MKGIVWKETKDRREKGEKNRGTHREIRQRTGV
jgi:hypothetical protein